MVLMPRKQQAGRFYWPMAVCALTAGEVVQGSTDASHDLFGAVVFKGTRERVCHGNGMNGHSSSAVTQPSMGLCELKHIIGGRGTPP